MRRLFERNTCGLKLVTEDRISDIEEKLKTYRAKHYSDTTSNEENIMPNHSWKKNNDSIQDSKSTIYDSYYVI